MRALVRWLFAWPGAAADALRSSAERLLAIMQFGEEEAKHIALFERFAEAFEFGFGSACEVIGPAADICDQVLAEDPLAVGLLTLHIEWMTQEHYTAGVRGREEIEGIAHSRRRRSRRRPNRIRSRIKTRVNVRLRTRVKARNKIRIQK